MAIGTVLLEGPMGRLFLMSKVPHVGFSVQLVVRSGPNVRYRGTSLIRKRHLLGPYRRPMPRVPGGS